jgi:predicted transcriptional regulator
VKERLAWLEGQITEFRNRNESDSGAAPARANRRATARRASARRATARQRQGDVKAQIIKYLDAHPASTAGDIAKGLNANRNTVSTRLSQMAKTGDIKKASRGYSSK